MGSCILKACYLLVQAYIASTMLAGALVNYGNDIRFACQAYEILDMENDSDDETAQVAWQMSKVRYLHLQVNLEHGACYLTGI